MESLKDVTKVVATSVMARAKNPLVGSFLLSWPVYNWKSIMHGLAVTEPIDTRIQAISAQITQPQSLYIPALFALCYFIISPWLWMVLRRYVDIAEDRDKIRQRERDLSDIQYLHKFAEAETKLLQEQRQKLQLSKEIQKKKDELTTLFDQQLEELKLRFSSAAETLNSVANEVESRRIPTLLTKIENIANEADKLKVTLGDDLAKIQMAATKLRLIAKHTVSDATTDEMERVSRVFPPFREDSVFGTKKTDDTEAGEDQHAPSLPDVAGIEDLDDAEVPAYARRKPRE